MASTSGLQPAWDLVTQKSLLYSYLPHHHCGQSFAASQARTLGTRESVGWISSFLSPSTSYWLWTRDCASAFLPWLTQLVYSWPGSPVLSRLGGCPHHGLLNLGYQTAGTFDNYLLNECTRAHPFYFIKERHKPLSSYSGELWPYTYHLGFWLHLAPASFTRVTIRSAKTEDRWSDHGDSRWSLSRMKSDQRKQGWSRDRAQESTKQSGTAM